MMLNIFSCSYLLSIHFCLNTLPILIALFAFLSSFECFIYFGYKSLIGYMIFRYLVPVFFQEQTLFNLDKVRFSHFFFLWGKIPGSVWLVRIQSWAGRTFLISKQTLCTWGPCQLWEAIDLGPLCIVEARKAFQFHPVTKVPKASCHAPLSLLFYLIFPLVPIRQLFRMSILYFFLI